MTAPPPVAPRPVRTDSQPATFLERGATVPFTSPLLEGARIRLAGGRREVVLRNPSGGAGWYVGPWESVVELARVTVHDRLVFRRIEEMGAISPLEIRRAARTVAAEGYAGQAAKAAAVAALEAEERDWRAAYAALLAALIAQAGLAGAEAVARARSRQELLALAPSLLAPLAPRLGLAAEALARAAEDLAAVLARIGPAEAPAQTARDLAALDRLLAEVAALAEADPRADQDAARAVLGVGRLAAALAADALARARAEAARPLALVAAWAEDRAAMMARLTRAEWLLDGWAALVARWDAAADQTPGRRRLALADLHRLLPVLPREVTGGAVQPAAPTSGRRVARGGAWLGELAEAEGVRHNEGALARTIG